MSEVQGTHDNERYFIGIDVGTGSARAGVFSSDGAMLAAEKHPIALYKSAGSIVEQSSAEIWNAVTHAVRNAVAASGVARDTIAGIGFDATCSLVVIGENGSPLPVGDPGQTERNIIVWMDHRALKQAELINATNHPVLKYVGGTISPEMETPKLLWLKENRPATYRDARHFFDLTDYLTWMATGDPARSICTVTCKWTYLGHEKRWDPSYFETIGLGDLAQEGFERIGTRVVEAGTPLGGGLCARAAADFGLPEGIPVGAGLIDAHAGGIGSVGAAEGGGPETNLAYVFGTSSCTMTTTREPVFVSGVWGPYFSAMVPGAWLNEGGQSAAGAAIEQLIDFHPFATEAHMLAGNDAMSLPEWLADKAIQKAASLSAAVKLAGGLHIVPEVLGNRAPYADPHTRAVIAGIGMDRDLDSLVALYVAGLCGLGYGLRQIIEAQNDAGAPVERIVISGGAGRSALIRQILADATGVEVAAPQSEEPVLSGSAILGAVASGFYPDIRTAMRAMSSFSERIKPSTGEIRKIHDDRYAIFKDFQGVARRAAAR